MTKSGLKSFFTAKTPRAPSFGFICTSRNFLFPSLANLATWRCNFLPDLPRESLPTSFNREIVLRPWFFWPLGMFVSNATAFAKWGKGSASRACRAGA